LDAAFDVYMLNLFYYIYKEFGTCMWCGTALRPTVTECINSHHRIKPFKFWWKTSICFSHILQS